MNLNFIINLNDDEKRLMTNQCVKEFKREMNSIKICKADIKKHLEARKNLEAEQPFAWQGEMLKLARLNRRAIQEIGLSRQRALAICDIVLALGLTISDSVKRRSIYGAEYDRDGEMFVEFYNSFKPNENRIDKNKPYFRKLAIYMMYRAGIITKATRNQMLSLLKTKTVIQLQERTQRKLNKLQDAFLDFNRKIRGLVPPDEEKEIMKACGLHQYLVKKYGIKAVTRACIGR